jgi:hypothetical protein
LDWFRGNDTGELLHVEDSCYFYLQETTIIKESSFTGDLDMRPTNMGTIR